MNYEFYFLKCLQINNVCMFSQSLNIQLINVVLDYSTVAVLFVIGVGLQT